MYRLYGNVAGWKILDESEEEIDIIDTIGRYIDNHSEINYMVIDDSKGYDDTIRTIHNKKQYMNYMNEVVDKYVEKNKVKKLTKKK